VSLRAKVYGEVYAPAVAVRHWKPAWRGQETLGESRNKLIGSSSIGGDGTRTWYKDKIYRVLHKSFHVDNSKMYVCLYLDVTPVRGPGLFRLSLSPTFDAQHPRLRLFSM